MQDKYVYFIASKLTDYTNKMFTIMNEAFGDDFKITEKYEAS